MPRPKSEREPHTTTTMRLPKSLLDRMTVEAELMGVSRTRLFVIVMQAWFDALDEDRKGGK